MFVAAVAGVQGALVSIVSELAAANHGVLLFDHYLSVVRAESDLPVSRRPRPVRPLRRGIELRDVWFRYDDEHPWVLRGVDLFIPCGHSVALVGRNGCGKSTLVKLLCRFYDPTRGSIRWDGADLRDVPVADLRIHPTIAGLPRGYDTLLTRVFLGASDGADATAGVVLSGGQWQRVALARGLLRRQPDLMILDEPSAGLDAEAEHEVHSRLREHRRGRTSLLISHRLSAGRDADAIAVLAGGELVEQGTHGELMAGGSEYARLFTLQASGYERPMAGRP